MNEAGLVGEDVTRKLLACRKEVSNTGCTSWHAYLMSALTKTNNKVKNLFKGAVLAMLIFIAPALKANEIVNPVMNARHSETPGAAETQKLLDRLEEIKAMDVSKMTNKEKRALRKEVKAAEKKVQSSGVYVSVGALIIIVLLLIILL
jgi:hypothetical protein